MDDQSSTGKALLNIYKGLGIELFDSEGQIRSLYDILSDLSKQWETLDTNTKDYIALEQAGANQTQNFMALMNNFSTAVSATATAYDSLGSAVEENAAVVDSLQGKTAQLRATFQDFANDVVSSELLGGIIDLGNGLLKMADTIPTVVTQAGLLVGVLGPLTSMLGRFYIAPMLGKTAEAAIGLGKSFGIAGLAIGAAIPLVIALYNAWRDANPSFDEANEKIESLTSQIQSNQDRLKEINAIPWYERTTEINNERDALIRENDELADQIEYYKQLRAEKAQKVAGSAQDIYTGNVGEYRVYSKQAEEGVGAFTSFSDLEDAQAYIDAMGEGFGHLEEVMEVVTLKGSKLDATLVTNLRNISKELAYQGEVGDDLTDWWQQNVDVVKEQYNAYKDLQDAGEDLTTGQEELIQVYETLQGQYQSLNEQTQFLNENVVLMTGSETELNAKTQELITAYPELSSVLSINNGQLGINTKKLGEVTFASEESKIALYELIAEETVFNRTGLSVQQRVTALLQLAMAAGVASDAMVLLREAEKGDARAGQAIVARYGSLENYYNQLIGSVSKVNVAISGSPTGSGGGGVVGATTKAAKATKELAKSTEEASDATKELEKYLKAEEDRLKSVVSALEDKISAYEILFGYLQDQIDVEIDALEAQKQALQDQNEELQTQVELEEKLDALARAKSQKAMVYKNGRFQYVSDIDETSKAQADLEKYYRNQEYQAQLDAIDAQIQALENQKKQIDIGQEQIKQEQNLAKVVDQLGVDFTNGWRDVYDDLDVYLSGYKDSLADLEKYTDDIENLQQENIDYSKLWWEAYESGASQETLDAIHQLEVQRRAEAGDNSIYDPATGTWSDSGTSFKPASDETDSKGRPVSGVGSNQYNYLTDLLANGTEGQKAWARSELAAGHYQSGTTNARGGFSLVGEKGAELRVLNQGDGILPADITKNLWAWGSLTPATLVNALGGLGSSKMMNVSIANLNLPEVRDGEGFVNYMKNNFWRTAVQTNFNR